MENFISFRLGFLHKKKKNEKKRQFFGFPKIVGGKMEKKKNSYLNGFSNIRDENLHNNNRVFT